MRRQRITPRDLMRVLEQLTRDVAWLGHKLDHLSQAETERATMARVNTQVLIDELKAEVTTNRNAIQSFSQLYTSSLAALEAAKDDEAELTQVLNALKANTAELVAKAAENTPAAEPTP